MKDAMKKRGRRTLRRSLIALLLCVATVLPLANMTFDHMVFAADAGNVTVGIGTDALFGGTETLKPEDVKDAMHFIIRHWHAEDPDHELMGSHTVIVGGYVIDNGGGSYTYYARAYFADTISSDDGSDYNRDLTGFLKVDETTESNYIKISTDGGKEYVHLTAYPYHYGDTYYETFSGFSVSTGQTATGVNNGEGEWSVGAELKLDPSFVSSVHLVKSHVYYISRSSKVLGASDESEQNSALAEDFTDYRDTTYDDAGERKVYNTAEGLHTDKTASEHFDSVYDDETGEYIPTTDGRTFDLDLEAWFAGAPSVNVGMVLDASGSMGFLADTPTPIRVFDPNDQSYNPLGLTAAQMTALKGKVLKSGTTAIANTEFLDNTQLGYILNTKNTDNSKLGNSGYSYFIYDVRSSVAEFVPLGYWDGNMLESYDGKGNHHYGVLYNGEVIGITDDQYIAGTAADRAGWYYINPTSDWKTNYANDTVQSGKTFVGLRGISIKETLPANPAGITAPGGGTGRTYNADKSPNKFYIDSAGYLRCFYLVNTNGQDNGYGVSYVYQSEDTQYTKVEALQRALGSFVTDLGDRSPASRVSAVRFSTTRFVDGYLSGSGNAPDYGITKDKALSATGDFDMFVLLDWTNDSKESAGILSLERGTGGTMKGDTSENSVEQFNYGLTGGTYTWTGLRSFYDTFVKSGAKSPLESENKYLIIFTDGRDDEVNDYLSNIASGTPTDAQIQQAIASTKASVLAEELKNAGYTIITVMLTGGPVSYSTDRSSIYYQAKQFLLSISGGKNASDAEKTECFYATSVTELNNKYGTNYSETTNTVDLLTEIFSNYIIRQITDDLEDYSVQDYIDPRFDIVDAEGSTWHLNAEGNVVVVSEAGETLREYALRDSDTLLPVITLSGKELTLTEEALQAELHYDGTNNMYYLVWTGQTIPSCAANVTMLNRWKARVTVRAKEDFLGGNTVLSNGNGADQNYVYDPEKQAEASSGADRSTLKKAESPSKGFPRTTVDVGPGPDDVDRKLLIYMGEDLSANTVAKDLINAAKEASADSAAYYYWEYIERFAEYYNTHEHPWDLPEGITPTGENGDLTLDDMIGALFAEGNEIRIPYYYLPDDKGDNQTGTEAHEADLIGWLKFSMTQESVEGPEGQENHEYPNGESIDTETRYSEVHVTYTPLTEDQRKGIGEDEDDEDDFVNANNALVTEKKEDSGEPVYPWDPGYKPEAGNEVDSKTIDGYHETNLVSGEIALQIELSQRDIQVLLSAGITKIIYTADLNRYYPGTNYGTKAGTFTAEIEITGSGARLITAGIEYNSEDGSNYKSYVEEYGLPIGTYTLGNMGAEFTDASGNHPDIDPFTFYDPYVVDYDDGEYEDPENFEIERVPGHEEPGEYIAGLHTDSGEIILGESYDGKLYTDARFGIFRVSGYPSGELEISKTVEGSGGKDLAFAFTVELTIPDGIDLLPLPDCICAVCECDGCRSDEADAVRSGTEGFTFAEADSMKAIGGKYGITAYGDEDGTESDSKKCACAAGYAGGYPYIGKSIDGVTSPANGWLMLEKATDGEGNVYIGTVYLKHGQSIVIGNLPDGTAYKVTEVNIPDGYVLKDQTVVTGIIGVIDAAVKKGAAFTNIPTELTVSKTVEGSADDTQFEFTVTLTLPENIVPKEIPVGAALLPEGEAAEGDIGYRCCLIDKDGEITEGWLKLTKADDDTNAYTATVKLRHGERIVISELPVGTYYDAEEINIPDKYDPNPSVTGKNGTLDEDNGYSAEAKFINIPKAGLPATGGDGTVLLAMLGILLLGMAAMLRRMKN